MLYHIYELNHAAVAPFRAAAEVGLWALRHPLNPFAETLPSKTLAAAFDVFETTTRRYGKPEFGLHETTIDGKPVPITERIVWERPFCKVIHFEREPSAMKGVAPQQKLLIVAPLSGHYATLLRGTVEAMLPYHEVYITDWVDARKVPLTEGSFDLDDYIDYVIEMCHALGPDLHLLAVCQPSVPVFAAVAVMHDNDDAYVPLSMTLMGGPIDTRESPTEVNNLATERGTEWYERHVITTVPWPHPGVMRRVYPGFVQLSGFMAMNLDRHMDAHWNYFDHMVEGDGDSAEKHREFYDEYLSVMDMTSEFYLQTVDEVFVKHSLPKGEFTHRGKTVRPDAITRTALMTVEGEKDDISGVGQTKAAHKLCKNLPASMKAHWEQPGVGHYGVFNGTRWKSEIAPRVREFMAAHAKR
ncbi:polyhydroxyalkanoate depolymerase, intracellular [Parvibaculum lavamentivorans DS-1]|uniref:Polyhydroxyalkanoate depolymerase, intracellular n=1 Tax=Parvibaculum lavamentivorans (strain DS-1 / DSM 13023 / NCIMB 13966) TaxID=402881 RepID=A7HP02_PARL1|nr:polyhydroxyalkanoate depolymerase [Parvibaculum lavamentivorans]ABS61635.1 polyhydroxyalkanoate depolymerase, intracellular [Parvibaculum lavamentivorans DS-1]